MKTILHKADSRGNANFGWLDSKHTFSFGQYYNPDRIHFGMLRVLNDDKVIAGAGFPTHPHENMEIISIPLKGALAHKDSTGTEEVIHTGEVQIMSAGTGLTHSEYNASKTEQVNFLQIWVFPKEKNIKPQYGQKHFDQKGRKNKVQTVVAPDQKDALWINQDAWFSLADLEAGEQVDYKIQKDNNGVYVFVKEGSIEIENQKLGRRDALGVYDTDGLTLVASEDAEILLIDVPMN